MRACLTPLLCLLIALAGPAAAQTAPFASFDLAGPAVLNDPHDVDMGPDGRLYVADKFGNRIAVLDPQTLDLVGVILEGRLPGVHDISFDAQGRAAVAVTGLGAVLVFDDLTEKTTEPDLILAAPRTEGALAHSNGRIYAMAGGTGMVLAYEGDQLVASAPGHFGAHDLAESPLGTVWVADNNGRRIVEYSEHLEVMRTIEHPRFGFIGPRYLDVDDGGQLVVADQDAHRILLIDPYAADGGALIGVLGDGMPGAGPMKFDDPEGALVVGDTYYFADSDNNRIVRYRVLLN